MEQKQLSARGIIIGSIGAVIITCSSMFVALKISSLPWPIMFVALASMFALKLCKHTSLNEINVTHTIMSAGAMVAGGLAFTLPGIWMLNPDADVSAVKLFIVTIGGVILGLIFTALFKNHFVNRAKLPFAMGQAAADTLRAGDEGGKKAGFLFGSLGVAAVFTYLRDWLCVIPATKLSNKMMQYGSFGGIWLSPMLISIGYIIGPLFISVWFLGALIGDFGILMGGTMMGLWDAVTAANIKSSLGIGLMVGTGVGIILKELLPRAKDIFGPMFSKNEMGESIIRLRWAPIFMVVLAFCFTILTDMPLLASIITIIGVWLTTAMSAQCVGQSGINPMEIFGIIVLLAAKACTSVNEMAAFFIAAIVAVACGLTGDVMNDFKAGDELGTDIKAQWIGEAIGAVVGAFVSVAVLLVILNAYGPSAFGGEMFPAAQASAVAAMVGGISHVPSFIIGLVLAVILYIAGFPVMTLGLGVYLPFYLSGTAFIGGALRFIVNKFCPKFEENGTGSIIAAGFLGGESIVGVVIALIIAVGIIM